MTTGERLDIETLVPLLKKALRKGCRASRLLYVPELLEVMYPGDALPGMSQIDRAFRAEQELTSACRSYGGRYGEAAGTLLGLAAGTHGVSLDERRRIASRLLDGPGGEPPQPETVRRWRELEILRDIAILIADSAQASQHEA